MACIKGLASAGSHPDPLPKQAAYLRRTCLCKLQAVYAVEQCTERKESPPLFLPCFNSCGNTAAVRTHCMLGCNPCGRRPAPGALASARLRGACQNRPGEAGFEWHTRGVQAPVSRRERTHWLRAASAGLTAAHSLAEAEASQWNAGGNPGMKVGSLLCAATESASALLPGRKQAVGRCARP